MAKPTFNTIPTELVEHAEVAYEHFDSHGYKIKAEPIEIHYPSRPALVCKINHTQVAIIVCGKIDIEQLKNWVQFAKSLNFDFRVSICIPSESTTRHLPKHQLKINELGIGIYVSTNGKLTTLSEAIDQNIKVALPDLKSLPKRARRALGPAYEHFDGGRWRDCFEEACKALEQSARPYFKNAISTGRLTAHKDNGAPKVLTAAQIDKLTLGQLGHEIGLSTPQNTLDTLIKKAIDQINSDRVGLVHKNKKAATEKRLRNNVGLHMHSIIQAIKQIK